MKSSFSTQAKEVLHKRIGQIIIIIDKHKYFGFDKINDELDALVGAIALRTEKEERGNSKKFVDRVMSGVSKLSEYTSKAQKIVTISGDTIEKISEISDNFSSGSS